jgi:hypothetical protein
MDVLLKEDLDDAVAVQRLRLDMLDGVDLRGELALVIVDDAVGHVLRQQPGVGPDDADDRNIDAGKYVGWRPHRRQRTEDRDEKRQHDKRVRPPEGYLNNPHFNNPSRPPNNYSFRLGIFLERKMFPYDKSAMIDGPHPTGAEDRTMSPQGIIAAWLLRI